MAGDEVMRRPTGAPEGDDRSFTVFFADICDSTGLYKRMGDDRARIAVTECLDAVDGMIAASGEVIERIGDEVMAVFPDPRSAVLAAMSIQAAMAEAAKSAVSGEERCLRIGLHHGAVIREVDAIFGNTVHVARRVASLAKRQQVLTTRQSLESMEESADIPSRYVDCVRLKGIEDVYEVHEIIWNQRDATISATATGFQGARYARLEMRAGANLLAVDDPHPVLTIGRDSRCNLVLDHAGISRLHARIEFNRGRFILADMSTNGTHIRPEGRAPFYLHHEQGFLEGQGIISLDPKGAMDGPCAIPYQCMARDANPG